MERVSWLSRQDRDVERDLQDLLEIVAPGKTLLTQRLLDPLSIESDEIGEIGKVRRQPDELEHVSDLVDVESVHVVDDYDDRLIQGREPLRDTHS